MEVLAAVSATIPAVLLLFDRARKRIRDTGGNAEAESSVEELHGLLDTFKAYIRNKEEGVWQDQGCHLTEDFSNKIQDLIFEIEDALDDFMYHVPHNSNGTKIGKSLSKAPNESATMRLTAKRSKIMEKRKTVTDLYRDLNVGQVPSGFGLKDSARDFFSNSSSSDQEMVGFEKRRDDLVKQLVDGAANRVTIEVVGLGGSGKTFLVNNVFRSQTIKQNFTDRAWISLPRHRRFNLKDLFFEILNSFCSRSYFQKIMQKAGSVEEKLTLYLEDKKFLIVLDGVRNKQDYDSVFDFFPNGLTGSRIVITTRIFDLVDKPGHIHKLEGLTKEEAWRLFCREAFHGRREHKSNCCPRELEDLAMRIVERCDGLPLAIVSIARLLSKKQRVNVQWSEFYNNIGYEIKRSNDPRLLEHIKPSLLDLSDNLRSCFLYFSMFPEGYSVTCGRLVRSWIGEGFVKTHKGMTLEKVAETYLNDLIRRSLVQVCKPEIDGRVETCKILKLHHAFIVHELYGERKNFLSVVDNMNPCASDEKTRRLSIHHVDVPMKLSEIGDLSNVRSFFAFGEQEVQSSAQRMVGRINAMMKLFKGKGDYKSMLENVFHKFRLLKVLDLENMPLSEFPKHIDSFVLLRSINLRNTKITTIPKAIKQLSLLEFLDVKNTLITSLPKWIRKLQKLRHLLVSHSLSPGGAQLGVEVSFGIGALSESLHEVKLIKAKNQKGFFKELGKLEKLRKLSLVDLKTKSGFEFCQTIQKMKYLSTLDVTSTSKEYLDLDHEMKNLPMDIQCLRLRGSLHRIPRWTSSLQSLVKVVLKSSKLKSNVNPLESLEDFHSLLELKMVNYYTGKRLVFKASTFKKLKKLHIEGFDRLSDVVFEVYSIPVLEKLTICMCSNLKRVPSGLCLGTLEEFVAYEMNNEFLHDVESRIDIDGGMKTRIGSRRYLS